MISDIKHISSKRLLEFVAVSVISIFYLNINDLHYLPLAIWAKLLPSMLLMAGVVAVIFQINILRIVGWLGILLFLIVSLAVSFPSEDYVLGGPHAGPESGPRDVSTIGVFLRVFAGVSITSLLSLCYRRTKSNGVQT